MDDYKFKKSMLFFFLLFFATIFMCIGYGAINPTNLVIHGTISATSYAHDNVYISDISLSADGGNSEGNNSDIDAQNLTATCDIKLSDSSTASYVEYNVTISNGNTNAIIYKGVEVDSNFYDNTDIVYEISDITLNDEISASGTKTFKLNFKYDSSLGSITNNELSAVIRFKFSNVYAVSYVGITGSPTKAYEGEEFTSNIGDSYYDVDVTIGGTSYNDYTFTNGILTITGTAVTGDIVVTPLTDTGTITATVNSSIDLSTNESTVVTLSVTSTYKQSKNFTLSINNSNLSLVDSGGSVVGTFTINANTTQTYQIYIKRLGSQYTTTTQSAIITLNINNGTTAKTNSITVTLPKDNPPTIGAVTLAMTLSSGTMTASWSGSDDGGGTVTYYIKLYNNSGTLIETKTQSSSSTSTLTQSLSTTGTIGTTYYVKVYGEDSNGNSGEEYLDSATDSTTYCKKSNLTGRFSVTTSGDSNVTVTANSSTVLYGETCTATTSFASNYVKDTMTVKMGDTTLSSDSGYTYSSNTITVTNVTGNIDISVTSSKSGSDCLVEGTNIITASGERKNIEDIDYSDLLLVWDFEHGKFTYEYPIWIEGKGKSNYYQLTTFSDGSTLKTVGYHGVFSYDYMEFISVDDMERFTVGSTVAKVEETEEGYEFKKVQVEKIEYIEEEVNYYEIVTTTYYNVISDDFITTDGNIILVNLYGFNDDLTWKKNRQNIIKDKNNLFEYDFLKDVMPYYMFEGLRAAEVKYISNLGYFSLEDVPYLKKKLNRYNEELLLKVETNSNGKRMWMVTTSDNIDTNDNKDKYKVEEESIYTLPEPNDKNGFLYWYNTSDGKYYYPGDEFKVWHGTHFIAVYN